MLNLLIAPLVTKIASELMNAKPSENPKENLEAAKEIIKKNMVPWYKQKTFWSAIAVIVTGILNYTLDLNIPVNDLFCG